MKDDTHTGTVASVRSGYESILIQNIGHVCLVSCDETRQDYVLLKIRELRLEPGWWSVFLVEEQGIFRYRNRLMTLLPISDT